MSNISSPFGQNEWLVEEMYRKFRDDPSSVDPSWHEFLVDYNPEPTGDSVLAAPASTDGPSAPAPAAPQTAQPALPAQTAPPAQTAQP
ncbi:2-oxoglutarate dehydrogenase E1 subunit family protein, partial [Mycobacterium avium]